MSDRKKVLPNLIPNIGFNLEAQEKFAKDHGIVFEHYAAIPSTIGQKDIGEYRRSDSLDIVSSNGFIYKKIGEFTGIIMGNRKDHNFIEGGLFDNSTARLVLPKFYNKDTPSDKKEITLLPGDRIYAKGMELKVDNYQKAEFDPVGEDILQFPAKCVSILNDSRNIEYNQNIHFKVSGKGNIKWLKGKKNPGIDPETGKGRAYSIRYTYLAFWYIAELLNEIRITNEGTSNEPSRMPYHAVIQREYVYHNKTRGDSKNSNTKENHDERTNDEPRNDVTPGKFDVKVNVRNFE